MKILQIHNYYQQRGGEDESVEAEERLLQDYGHHVVTLFEKNSQIRGNGGPRLAARAIWSREMYRKVEAICKKEFPDVAVIHNMLPLVSPSVLHACHRRNIPVILVIHNYRRICPGAILFRHGQVCETCIGWKFAIPGIVRRCYRNSVLATATVATISGIHHLLGTWERQVDRYIAVSEFTKRKMIEGGFPPDKICVKPNFVHPDPVVGDGSGGYIIFVGRLAPEKGVDTLIQAWRQLPHAPSLLIAGDGPEKERLCRETRKDTGIKWLGRRPIAEIMDIIGQASVLVFPSIWYETFGRVAAEAFSKGTPVIAAGHGAMAELVKDGQTGFLFTPGHVASLRQALERLFSLDDVQRGAMRAAARAEYEAKYTADRNHRFFMSMVSDILRERAQKDG